MRHCWKSVAVLVTCTSRCSSRERLQRLASTWRQRCYLRQRAGLQIGNMIGGAVVVEYVFARQGIGRMALRAILDKDYPMIQGVVLLTAVIYVVINVVVDISYAWLDPRIRYD